jgi:hypothetical protein
VGLALLIFARKKCGTKGATTGAETKVEPRPAKPQRTWIRKILHWLTTPVRREDKAKWRKEYEEKAVKEAAEEKGVTPTPEPTGTKSVKKDEVESKLTDIVVKVLGAIATGIGVTGAVVVVGASIFWARFDAIGIPPIQAVTDIPRTELLVQGGQEMVLFVLIGLGAALLITLADPKGDITYGSLIVLAGLVLGAAIFAITTNLSWAWVLGLSGLALILSLAAIGIGFTTGQRLLPLLVSVFIATFVFSASSAFLIVETQKFAQAIAIHFGPNGEGKEGKREGIVGIYVTATEKTLFYARADLNGADDVGLYEVPRTDTTTYAVGPPEQIQDDDVPLVEETGEALLESLKKDAESLPPPEAAGQP